MARWTGRSRARHGLAAKWPRAPDACCASQRAHPRRHGLSRFLVRRPNGRVRRRPQRLVELVRPPLRRRGGIDLPEMHPPLEPTLRVAPEFLLRTSALESVGQRLALRLSATGSARAASVVRRTRRPVFLPVVLLRRSTLAMSHPSAPGDAAPRMRTRLATVVSYARLARTVQSPIGAGCLGRGAERGRAGSRGKALS